MCAALNRIMADPQNVSTVRAPSFLSRLLLAFLLTLNVALLNSQAAEATGSALASAAHGPTIRLDYEPGKSSGNPVASFMYFVPLISPEPGSSLTSPGSTQSVRMYSAQRRLTANSFLTTCEFEFNGEGSHQSRFDLSDAIRRQERKLKQGAPCVGSSIALPLMARAAARWRSKAR
jgi:hypothetical protein